MSSEFRNRVTSKRSCKIKHSKPTTGVGHANFIGDAPGKHITAAEKQKAHILSRFPDYIETDTLLASFQQVEGKRLIKTGDLRNPFVYETCLGVIRNGTFIPAEVACEQFIRVGQIIRAKQEARKILNERKEQKNKNRERAMLGEQLALARKEQNA